MADCKFRLICIECHVVGMHDMNYKGYPDKCFSNTSKCSTRELIKDLIKKVK